MLGKNQIIQTDDGMKNISRKLIYHPESSSKLTQTWTDDRVPRIWTKVFGHTCLIGGGRMFFMPCYASSFRMDSTRANTVITLRVSPQAQVSSLKPSVQRLAAYFHTDPAERCQTLSKMHRRLHQSGCEASLHTEGQQHRVTSCCWSLSLTALLFHSPEAKPSTQSTSLFHLSLCFCTMFNI